MDIDLKVRVDIDAVGIQRKFDASVYKEMHSLGRKMRAQAKRYTKKRTGRLSNSIDYTVYKRPGGYTIVLKADTPYAAYYERGTRPHIIRAKNGGALKFQRRGKTVYATVVTHRGARGRFPLRRAVATVLARSR